MVENLCLLSLVYILVNFVDKLVWKASKKGISSVKSYYKSLCFEVLLSYPSKGICTSKVLTKVIFFDWEAVWGKILTIDHLMKRW